MKFFAKSALCAAIATSVFAASAQADISSFDPSLKATYKNYYWKQKDQEGYYRDSLVQALVLDLDSGYYNDMIGVVVTAGVANPLDVKKRRYISNLPVGEDGEANSFAGLQQAYVKTKFAVSGAEFKLDHGARKRSTELYGNSGSRILVASSYGTDFSVDYSGLNLYASKITAASSRNSSAFKRDLTNGSSVDPQKIGSVQIIGGNYTVAGVDLTVEHLVVKDTLKKNFFKAAYTFDLKNGMNLATDVRYGTAKKGGSLLGADNNNKTKNDKSDDFFEVTDKYESSFVNLNATLNLDNSYVGAGFNKVSKGNWNDFVGSVGNAGSFPSTLSQWYDHNLEGSKGYLLTAGHNFADQGLAGLSVDLTYALSNGAKGYKDQEIKEFVSYVSYQFDGQMKGLSLAWLHASGDDKRTTDAGVKTDEFDRTNRFYLKYTKAIF